MFPLVIAAASQLSKQLQTTPNLLTKGLWGEKCNTYFGDERSSEKRVGNGQLVGLQDMVSLQCTGGLAQEFKDPKGNVF